jgi:hypothetical protein
VSATSIAVEVAILQEALERLEHLASRKAEVVRLHGLAGLSIEETAVEVDVSRATVGRQFMGGPTMDSDRLRAVEELFHEAGKRDPAERGAFLDGACRDDLELRSEVESLLAHGSEGPAPKPVGASASISERGPLQEGPGARIGPTSCPSSSVRAALAWSTWPSRGSRSGGA